MTEPGSSLHTLNSQIVYEQSRRKALEAFRSSKPEPAPTSASDADWMALSEVRRRTDSAGSLWARRRGGRASQLVCVHPWFARWYGRAAGGAFGGRRGGARETSLRRDADSIDWSVARTDTASRLGGDMASRVASALWGSGGDRHHVLASVFLTASCAIFYATFDAIARRSCYATALRIVNC